MLVQVNMMCPLDQLSRGGWVEQSNVIHPDFDPPIIFHMQEWETLWSHVAHLIQSYHFLAPPKCHSKKRGKENQESIHGDANLEYINIMNSFLYTSNIWPLTQ